MLKFVAKFIFAVVELLVSSMLQVLTLLPLSQRKTVASSVKQESRRQKKSWRWSMKIKSKELQVKSVW